MLVPGDHVRLKGQTMRGIVTHVKYRTCKGQPIFEDFVNVLFANRIAAQFDVYDVKQLILIREAQLYREDTPHEDSDTGRQIGIVDDDTRQPGIDP